ncbi:fido domain-containing protein [Cristinia sonorae]|uniref:protein adenylyltransferase n=1 Tax=Cristinia sonorae TaxID=1940300 RepID=A0A8K0UK50_9AGAR|nr:fido domain-containing protein [Cristinia sonorae]
MDPQHRTEMIQHGNEGTLPQLVKRYERMHELYPQLPYFTARLGDLFRYMGAESLAVFYYRQAKDDLYELGDDDEVLDNLVLELGMQAYNQAVHDANTARLAGPYSEPWKPTALHEFPSGLPFPHGHEELLAKWTKSKNSDSVLSERYLRRTAIDSNQLESIFLLTKESSDDLTLSGLGDAIPVHCQPLSSITESPKIKQILKDMLDTYEVVFNIAENQKPISPDFVTQIHKGFMDTCRFIGETCYVTTGITRAETLKTVVIRGERDHPIQLCPYGDVTKELNYICNAMNINMPLKWKNPFAAASWIYLVLIRCHPFEDGNGRLTRMIASLPLIQHGYPPISISLSLQEECQRAIGRAYIGDHSALMGVLFKGMRQTLEQVEAL